MSVLHSVMKIIICILCTIFCFIDKLSEKMCLIRDTEKIVVPNRGARLGNFGCFSMEDKKKAFVFASEWMQTNPPKWWDYTFCMQFGSKNDIFVTEITLD